LIGFTIIIRTATNSSVAHRPAQRLGIHGDLDQKAGVPGRVAQHPDDVVAGIDQLRHGVPHQRQPGGIPEVIGRGDRPRDWRRQRQLADLVPSQDDVVDLRVLQKLGLDLGREHVVGQQRKRGDLRPVEPRQQIVLAEPRH
jgi:hypothetical protein